MLGGNSVEAQSFSDSHSILSRTLYTSADSLRVVHLLQQPIVESGGEVMHYARQFTGTPYVAHTLEKDESEKLVVNLRQLDCTTLVETVLALAMTKRQKGDSFAAYCQNLMKIRYWGGQMNGYLSRLHYFSWWMEDNLQRGHIRLVTHPDYFIRTHRVSNSYMSTHPTAYKFLKNSQERVARIKVLEQQYNDKEWAYLPASLLGTPALKLSTVIHEGDVIALVTRKKGLDFSHLGFAVWGKDNLLHLFNASSLHHKVVDEPKSLKQYVREHPSCLGICVMRLADR